MVQGKARGDGARKPARAVRSLELVQGLNVSSESRLRCTAPIRLTLAEDRQQPVSHVLQHLAAFRLDRGHEAVEVAIQELDGLLRRQGGGDPGVVPHVGKQNGRADPADLTSPDGAGQNGAMGRVTNVDPKDIIEVMMQDADLHHGRNRRHTNRRTRKPCSPKPSGARVAKVSPCWEPLVKKTGTTR